MSDENDQDLVPEDNDEGLDIRKRKERKSFKNVKRELSDEDLAIPAVQRLVLDEIDRLEWENDDLKQYQEKFYTVDKRVAVLEEKRKIPLAMEVISSTCFTIGGAALGYAPTLGMSQPSAEIIAIVFGVVLVIGGIVGKAIKR